MKERIKHITAAPDWWAEMRFPGESKLEARLPVAFWVFTVEGDVAGVCFDDSRQPFLAESDEEIEVTYHYGKKLKQVGIGLPQRGD